MKNFKEFILVVFSIIILAVSIITVLVSLGYLNISNMLTSIPSMLNSNVIIALCISSVFAILALVGIFSNSGSEEDIKAGLAIKHENGTVYISRDTFESIVLNVTKSYASLKNVRVSVTISEVGAVANVFAYILPDTVVPTLTAKLQENIKDSVLKQTTVEIKEANIKIKGVYNQVEKKA